jgi:hypothetical protein
MDIPEYYKNKVNGIVEWYALNTKYFHYPKGTKVYFNNSEENKHLKRQATEITHEFHLEYDTEYCLLLRNNKITKNDNYFEMTKVGYKPLGKCKNWNLNILNQGYFLNSQFPQEEGQGYAYFNDEDIKSFQKKYINLELTRGPCLVFMFPNYKYFNSKSKKKFSELGKSGILELALCNLVDTKIHPRLKLIMFDPNIVEDIGYEEICIGMIYLNSVRFESYTPLAFYDADESSFNFDFLSYYCIPTYFNNYELIQKSDFNHDNKNKLAIGFMFPGTPEDKFNGFFNYILFKGDLINYGTDNISKSLKPLDYSDGDYVEINSFDQVSLNLNNLRKKYKFDFKNNENWMTFDNSGYWMFGETKDTIY